MFRPLMTVIRELYLYLIKVTFMLKHSVKLRRFIYIYIYIYIYGESNGKLPQELAQDAVCQSHTGHMTELWFLPSPAFKAEY